MAVGEQPVFFKPNVLLDPAAAFRNRPPPCSVGCRGSDPKDARHSVKQQSSKYCPLHHQRLSLLPPVQRETVAGGPSRSSRSLPLMFIPQSSQLPYRRTDPLPIGLVCQHEVQISSELVRIKSPVPCPTLNVPPGTPLSHGRSLHGSPSCPYSAYTPTR